MAKKGPELVDPRLVTAGEHPLRVEIMGILLRGPSSAARIQRELDNVSLNLVAHHMKVLKDLDCIELQETVTRRGAREHIFRIAEPAIVSAKEIEGLTPQRQYRLSATVLRAISQDLSISLSRGLYNSRTNSHASRAPLTLDEQGWAELIELLEGTLGKVLEIGEKSRERLESSDDEPVQATVAILGFPTTDAQ